MSKPETVAQFVTRLPLGIVNAYVVGDTRGRWFLVDSGMTGNAGEIERMVREIPGLSPRPDFILLTHGHFDHAGSARELAGHWDVPVLVHQMDIPYVTSGRDYPPPDPTVGGPMGLFLRLSGKRSSVKVGGRVKPLDGATVPGFEDWRIVETPGHTPGHVSLFRQSDRTLVAGDAVVTLDPESFAGFLLQTPAICAPVAAATYDWESARRSVEALAELQPSVIAAGHGRPIHGPEASRGLEALRNRFRPPAKGRYAKSPARFDEHGPVSIPAPVDDPFPRQVALASVGLLALIGLVALVARPSHERRML